MHNKKSFKSSKAASLSFSVHLWLTCIRCVSSFRIISCNSRQAKKLIILTAIIFPALLKAQSHLSIGDKLPSLQIGNIINHSDSVINTKSFTGKLIILDFGATTCVPCIREIPHLDSLQKKFGNRIQIVMVSAEDKERVKRFLQTNKIAAKTILPVITADTMLNALFPHTALPHEVWINDEGRIVAITDQQYVTSENIEQVLNKEIFNWPVKADAQYSKQQLNNKKEKTALFWSSFSSYRAGLNPRGIRSVDTSGNTTYISCINFSIPAIYKFVLGITDRNFYPQQLIVDSSLNSRLFYNANWGYKADWTPKHTWCYEQQFPLSAGIDKIREKMRQELDIYFGITTQYEKRQLDCLVVYKEEGKKQELSANKKNNYISLKAIFNYYNQESSLPVLINNTGTTDIGLNRIFIDIDKEEVKNLNVLKQQLKKAGYIITREKKWIDTLEFKPDTKK